jgi:hypothetical protein
MLAKAKALPKSRPQTSASFFHREKIYYISMFFTGYLRFVLTELPDLTDLKIPQSHVM